jgi:hypothetical protein
MLLNVGIAVKLYVYVTSTNITSLLVRGKTVNRGLTTLKFQCFPITKVSPDFHNFCIPSNRHIT